MTGNSHDGSCPIFHKNIIGYPDRNFLSCVGIDGFFPCIDALLLLFDLIFFEPLLFFALFNPCLEPFFLIGIGNQFLAQRVLWGNGHKSGSIDRIDTGCEDLYRLVRTGNWKCHMGSLTLPDPVLLH